MLLGPLIINYICGFGKFLSNLRTISLVTIASFNLT